MKTLFVLGFFLACQSLMAQTYTMTGKTGNTRSTVTFTTNLKTGVSTTTTAATTSSELQTFTKTSIDATLSYPVWQEPTYSTFEAQPAVYQPATSWTLQPASSGF